VKRAMVKVELRKRVDKLVYQLGFGYVTGNIFEKEAIESIVNQLIELGLIDEMRWQKVINNVLRYVNKIDGMDTRTRIRRLAEEIDKMMEEGLR
jgi:hypothetical protein